MFAYLDICKIECIIYRLGFHNLQTRKKSEMVQTVQIELSMLTFNAYVTGHLRDMFYDSKTQLIQFTD